MTKREYDDRARRDRQLLNLGFTARECDKLRRISHTLHRWHELECGDSNQYGSWAIERDDNGDGPPFMVRHHYRHGQGKDTVTRTRVADLERGALRRLQAILGQRNGRPCIVNGQFQVCDPRGPITYYIQTDPRGAALYLLRPGDVPAGGDVSSYYDRGVCVW